MEMAGAEITAGINRRFLPKDSTQQAFLFGGFFRRLLQRFPVDQVAWTGLVKKIGGACKPSRQNSVML
jgi:hypothetical protein